MGETAGGGTTITVTLPVDAADTREARIDAEARALVGAVS